MWKDKFMLQIKIEVLKYWNELYNLFVVHSCQKIEYSALIFSPVANFGDHPLFGKLFFIAKVLFSKREYIF